MFKLIKYLRGYIKECIMAPLFKFLEACFELTVPVIMAHIIDTGIAGSDREYILKMCGVLVLMGILGLCSALTAQFFAARAAYGFGTAVRRDMFKKINSLSMSQLDKFGTSSLITRITGDINRAESGVNMFLRLFLRSPFIVIGAMAAALMLDARVAVVFLVAVPVMGLLIYILMHISVPFYKKAQTSLDRVSQITRENLTGVRVIRAFSRQGAEIESFSDANAELMSINEKVGSISALMNPLTYIVVNLAVIAVLWVGGIRVNIGGMQQGEVVAMVNYLTQILVAMLVLAQLIVTLTKAMASGTRIAEVLELQPDMTDDAADAAVADSCNTVLEFDNVSFEYSGSKEDALSGISFKLKRGQNIGIIGGTGSGKSTLVNLIPRFYDATSGSVKIDGTDVRNMSFKQLRGKIGYVPQKASLLTGTIRENMRWRNENADDNEIINALKTAQAYDFIFEKDGLDTSVSQEGKNFSGGQRQRLTIARALVSDPEILILDDSSSALDLMTEARLRRALSKANPNMTQVIVSQRISTIRDADLILVLDDGSAVGMGMHKELLESCEIYREICATQIPEELAGTAAERISK
ncbi:MAG: ABC transporter ATP-binding protein [Clostridiales bacterium]|nr:ABC transporter ATP-binding protein [Clostridiales bacterium]